MTDRASVAAEIERFLGLLWQPGEVRELRIPRHNKYGQTASGYFDSPATLAKAAATWDGKANLYFTLNPVNPPLLARASNRINDRAEHTTADTDILQRRWLYIDVDPIRPSGISSTEAEREAALAALELVTDFLSDAGWPLPVTAMSGNGYYALYRVDLPNTPESAALIKAILESLASKFNTPAVHIDPTVYNASRIAAVIGTLKRKGDPTPDRPHRRSQLVSVPEDLLVVEEGLLHAVADQAPKPAKLSPSSRDTESSHAVSLQGILDRHGIEYHIQPPDAKGITWFHLRRCPFHSDGRDFECGVGQSLPDGKFAGHCFHPEGGGYGWQEWKEALGLRIGRSDDLPSPSTDCACAGADQEDLRSKENSNLYLPVVIIGRQLPEVTADALTTLIKANDPPVVFVRSGELVRLAKDENGTPSIQRLSDAALRGHLARAAKWYGFNKQGERIEVSPPKAVVEDLAALPSWRDLPPLAGIVFAPTLRQDGTILNRSGYDASSKLYCHLESNQEFPTIPMAPTFDDVRLSLETIEDIFFDFPWASQADRANAYAMLITSVIREAIDGSTPIFGVDAPRAGSGKGLLTDVVAIVATGNAAFKTTPPSRGNEDEWRKLLLGLALDGHPIAVLDNVESTLRSGALASFVTARHFSGRVLGLNKTVTAPNRVVMLLTGNNLSLAGDLPRRMVAIRLDSQMARPWEREGFAHPDLLVYVRRNRHQILAAVLTLARAWYAAGQPKTDTHPLGSFEEWTAIAGGILQHVGVEGFLGSMAETYDRMDASTPAWESFLTAWFDDSQERALTVAQLVERIRQCAALQETLPDELADSWAARINGAERSSFTKRLGKALATKQDVVYGNLKLERGPKDTHSKVNTWRVVQVAGFAGYCGISSTPPTRDARMRALEPDLAGKNPANPAYTAAE
jgi:hypothetical protein